MTDVFPRVYTVSKEEDHKKDVRILDGDVTIYGLFRRDTGRIAEIVKFSESGSKTLLAEIEWLGEDKDKIRFPGGDWQRVQKAWVHYKYIRDKEVFSSSFIGADDKKYVWYQKGASKLLSIGTKGGPVVVDHFDHAKVGTLTMKNEADAAGDMLFITFLTNEGARARPRRISWFALFFGGYSGGGGWSSG